jgi:hypothetical protein
MPVGHPCHPVGLLASLRVSTDPLGGPQRMETGSWRRSFAANTHCKEPS